METHILIKHPGATGSAQAEDFAADKVHELTIGRDTSCDVKFDPNDDLVSRRHAKITAAAGDGGEYKIADLGSRNGTFVNKQRIFGPVVLHCGDTVQLGPGGPEFEFDLDPRPASMVKATRLADDIAVVPAGAMAPTREAGPPAGRAPMGLGKATVERMIGQVKSQSRKTLYMVAGGLVVLLAAVAAVLYFARPKQTTVVQTIEQKLSPSGLTPTQIAHNNTDATVMIEVGWKLVDMETGRQLFHTMVPNKQKVVDKEGRPVRGNDGKPKEEEIAPGADPYLPAFMVVEGNKLEPLLSTDDNDGHNQPIGEMGSGSGFVVSNDGFILTNRHVAAGWHTRYTFPAKVGVVLVPGEKGQGLRKQPIPRENFPAWVPAQARLVMGKDLDTEHELPPSTSIPKYKAVEGRNDFLDITFAKNRIRIPAKLARVSDHMDVAMVKIDLPQTLKKVELNDNYESIKVGDPVVTLGYPAVSDMVIGVVPSRDVFNQQVVVHEIPDPTLAAGNIGRVLRGQIRIADQQVVQDLFPGDYYQLTINSTGMGNSGGPMFDDQGRVIGIFTLGKHLDVNISGAIPIRYGMELMGVQSAVK